VLLKLGELDFGKGQVGKCDVAMWRTRGEHQPLDVYRKNLVAFDF
jgi:hypothetical protein